MIEFRDKGAVRCERDRFEEIVEGCGEDLRPLW